MKRKTSFYTLQKVLILSVVLFTLSCKKKENTIGTELYDDKVDVNIIDNIIINTYTTKQDSLRSDELSISTLGSYIDPVFGKTTSSIYTHLRLSADNINFAPTGTSADIVLDSIILSLKYHDSYGTFEPQTFEVYEITEDITLDSAYYNNKSFANTGVNLVEPGAEIITPNLTQGVFVDGDSLEPQLRIKLTNAFGQKIINESGNTTLSDNDNFLQFIKGIYITTNNSGQITNEGAILSLDLLHSNSKVTLYYRDTVLNDTSRFNLLINATAARVNVNTHSYTGTLIESQLNDSTLGNNETYIQGLAGVKTQIEFTDLERLKDSNYIINKAVLTLPVNFTGGNYTPNTQLLILRNQNENQFITPDQITYGIGKVGGKWNENKVQYEFNITRYINQVLNNTYPNNKLTIETTSSLVTPNRAILYGDQSTTNKPKLTLTYTKY